MRLALCVIEEQIRHDRVCYPPVGCVPSKLSILPVLTKCPIVDRRFPENILREPRVTMEPFCFEHGCRATPPARVCPNDPSLARKPRHAPPTFGQMADRNVARAIYRLVANLIVIMLKAPEKIISHELLLAGVHACAG